MSLWLEQITEAVVGFNYKEIDSMVLRAVREGLPPDKIINDALIKAMDLVGRRFSSGEIYVPEMLYAARTMKKGLEALRPHLKGKEVASRGKVIIGTVKGDLHDIGKNLVIMMLEGVGLQVVDLGVDVRTERFVESIEKTGTDVLAMSALLTTTMPEMKHVIDAVRERGLRERVKIIVGGAPVTARFASEIGADGYGQDAAAAARIANDLIHGSGYSGE